MTDDQPDGRDRTDGPDEPGSDREPVGSVAEEAAALFAALSGAAGTGGGLGEALGEAWHNVDQHLATDATECTWCPVCQVIHAVRTTSPEVKEHLTVAAGSLLQAASSFLATRAGSGRPGDSGSTPVEKIDLDDDGTEGPDDAAPGGPA